jgi:very-short-patch-repair endonuclease
MGSTVHLRSEDYQDGYPPAWLLRLTGRGRKRRLTYLEKRFRSVIYSLGIYGFRFNYYVYSQGKHHFIDAAYPPGKIGFECDSVQWHRDLRKDLDRDKRLEMKGWHMYHFSSRDILDDFDGVANRIVAIIESESEQHEQRE